MAGCVLPFFKNFTSLERYSQPLSIQKQVEGEIQGEPDLVQKLLKDVDKGPRHAHVVKLEKSDIDTQEDEKSFEIRR